MDRTNWKFGQTHINILMIAISYQGLAFPLIYKIIPKAGLRISDILTLRWDNYTEERISIRMRKTDKTITIPVSESVKEIIGRRRRILENNGIQITPDRYIFNILRVDVNKISAQDTLNAISSATAVINRNLK